MNGKVIVTIAILCCSCLGYGQEVSRVVIGGRRCSSVADLSQVSPWPRISGPPKLGASDRPIPWDRERGLLLDVFAVIKQDWPGALSENAYDLRLNVHHYEDLIRKAVQSGGYANLLLADALRKLSDSLLVQYIVAYPYEYAVVGELLESDRTRLLDSPAVKELIADDLKVAPPADGWHLSARWEDWDLLFRKSGLSMSQEMDRVVWGEGFKGLSVSKFVGQRDVPGLLITIRLTEKVERYALPGLVAFLRLGGKLEDLTTGDPTRFLMVMGRQVEKFSFRPMGLTVLSAGDLAVLVKLFGPYTHKPVPFGRIIIE